MLKCVLARVKIHNMIDYEDLEKALKEMKPRSKLYEIIKKEMQTRGRWKQKPRGNGFNKGYDKRRKHD